MPLSRLPSYIAFRGLVSRVVLVMYVLAVTGVAIPVPVSAGLTDGKDRSIPFPCMDKSCGCMSAAQCYRGCCCSTREERVAWFAAHDIDTSTFAAEKPHESAMICEAPPTIATESHGSCCSKPAVQSCCAKAAGSAEKSCCSNSVDGSKVTLVENVVLRFENDSVCTTEKYSVTHSSSKPKASCCDAKPVKKSCCEKIARQAEDQEPVVTWTGISISALLRCRGAGETFFEVPLSIPSSLDPPELGAILPLESVALIELSYDAPAFVPDAPPPRT